MAKKIWIDLDNSPHVVLFRPIIAELEKRGYTVLLTARRCFQVCELADKSGLPYKLIGRHYGKSTLMKVMGLALRSFAMAPFILREKPHLALSHGSRSQILASKAFGIPSVLMFDYEHTRGLFGIRPDWLVAPELLRNTVHAENGRVFFYPGIKEDIYVPDFEPDGRIRKDLGISADAVLATVRPPATEANYHRHESEVLFWEVIDYLDKKENVSIVLLPRNERQGKKIAGRCGKLLESGKMIIPDRVIDGLNLIWHSDLVISGGGTMNREAAALGVPVYSTFRGKTGEVDKYLFKAGRLTLIQGAKDIGLIKVEKWTRPEGRRDGGRDAISAIIEIIEQVASNGRSRPVFVGHGQLRRPLGN